MRLPRILFLTVLGSALVVNAAAQEEARHPSDSAQRQTFPFPPPQSQYPAYARSEDPEYQSTESRHSDYPRSPDYAPSQSQDQSYPQSQTQYPDTSQAQEQNSPPAQRENQNYPPPQSQYPSYPQSQDQDQGYPQSQNQNYPPAQSQDRSYPPAQSQYPSYPQSQDQGYPQSQYPSSESQYPPPQGQYPPYPPQSYPPQTAQGYPPPPVQTREWVPQGIGALGQYATGRTEFTLDHSMLVLATKMDRDNNNDLRRVVAGVNGVSVHSFRFAGRVSCDPVVMSMINEQYRGAGFQHLVSQRRRDAGGVGTDLWLRVEHGAVTDIAVLVPYGDKHHDRDRDHDRYRDRDGYQYR